MRPSVPLDSGAPSSPCLCLPAQTQPLGPCSSAEKSAWLHTESSELLLSSGYASLSGSPAISNCVLTALSSTEVSVRFPNGDLVCCHCLPSHSFPCESHAKNGEEEELKSTGRQRFSTMVNVAINKQKNHSAGASFMFLHRQFLIILCLANIFYCSLSVLLCTSISLCAFHPCEAIDLKVTCFDTGQKWINVCVRAATCFSVFCTLEDNLDLRGLF